jgi:ATP-dependent Clp protease protease subunit
MGNSYDIVFCSQHHVVSGQTTDIIIKAKKAEHTRETLSNIIQTHSGKAEKDVNAALERDTYMTASEAKKFGIVDHTVTRITEIEGLDLDKGNGKK